MVEREPHLPAAAVRRQRGPARRSPARAQRAAVEAGGRRRLAHRREQLQRQGPIPPEPVAPGREGPEAACSRPLRRDPAAIRPQRRPQHLRPEPAVRRHQGVALSRRGASTSATCRSSSRRRAATSTTSTRPCVSSSTGLPTDAAAAATRRPARGSEHELLRDVASREPRARRLPDAGARLRDRPLPRRQLPARERRRHPARRCPRGPARHPRGAGGEDRLLRPLPLRHRLQGRSAVLPRTEEERPVAGDVDRRAVRLEPRRHRGRGAGHGLRLRHCRRPDGRRVHGVDGHRDRGEHDLPARPAGGGDDAPPEQHPRCVRGELPRRHGLRRLVPVQPRAAAPQGGPEGGEPEARRADSAPAVRPAGGGATSAYREWDVRAYRLAADLAHRTVADLERSFAPARVFVQRVRRGIVGGRRRARDRDPGRRRGGR